MVVSRGRLRSSALFADADRRLRILTTHRYSVAPMSGEHEAPIPGVGQTIMTQNAMRESLREPLNSGNFQPKPRLDRRRNRRPSVTSSDISRLSFSVTHKHLDAIGSSKLAAVAGLFFAAAWSSLRAAVTALWLDVYCCPKSAGGAATARCSSKNSDRARCASAAAAARQCCGRPCRSGRAER